MLIIFSRQGRFFLEMLQILNSLITGSGLSDYFLFKVLLSFILWPKLIATIISQLFRNKLAVQEESYWHFQVFSKYVPILSKKFFESQTNEIWKVPLNFIWSPKVGIHAAFPTEKLILVYNCTPERPKLFYLLSTSLFIASFKGTLKALMGLYFALWESHIEDGTVCQDVLAWGTKGPKAVQRFWNKSAQNWTSNNLTSTALIDISKEEWVGATSGQLLKWNNSPSRNRNAWKMIDDRGIYYLADVN